MTVEEDVELLQWLGLAGWTTVAVLGADARPFAALASVVDEGPADFVYVHGAAQLSRAAELLEPGGVLVLRADVPPDDAELERAGLDVEQRDAGRLVARRR